MGNIYYRWGKKRLSGDKQIIQQEEKSESMGSNPRDKISVSEYLRKKNGTKLIGESQKRLKYLLSKDIMKLFWFVEQDSSIFFLPNIYVWTLAGKNVAFLKVLILPDLRAFLEVAALSMNSMVSSMKILPKWMVGSVAKIMPRKFVSSVMYGSANLMNEFSDTFS